MVALLLPVYTADHVKGTVLFQLFKQSGTGSEIEVGVGKGTAGSGVHLNGDVDLLVVLDGGSRFNFEHGVYSIRSLLGNK